MRVIFIPPTFSFSFHLFPLFVPLLFCYIIYQSFGYTTAATALIQSPIYSSHYNYYIRDDYFGFRCQKKRNLPFYSLPKLYDLSFYHVRKNYWKNLNTNSAKLIIFLDRSHPKVPIVKSHKAQKQWILLEKYLDERNLLYHLAFPKLYSHKLSKFKFKTRQDYFNYRFHEYLDFIMQKLPRKVIILMTNSEFMKYLLRFLGCPNYPTNKELIIPFVLESKRK